MDIKTAAPVIIRDEILIQAPIETIWEIQTDVAGWPSWQPEVDGAQIDGPLAVGSVFRWQTAGLDISSTVEEIDPPRRIVWGAPAQGIVAVHVWTFEPQEGGVLVRTAESGRASRSSPKWKRYRGPSMGRCAAGWRTSSAQPNRAWSAAHRRRSGLRATMRKRAWAWRQAKRWPLVPQRA
jgi:uncharacterized protein YndB with AHSA1/START domain